MLGPAMDQPHSPIENSVSAVENSVNRPGGSGQEPEADIINQRTRRSSVENDGVGNFNGDRNNNKIKSTSVPRPDLKRRKLSRRITDDDDDDEHSSVISSSDLLLSDASEQPHNSIYQAPPGYSLRQRKVKIEHQQQQQQSRFSARSTTNTRSTRSLGNDDKSFSAKMENLADHRPATRGIRASYKEFSEGEDFDDDDNILPVRSHSRTSTRVASSQSFSRRQNYSDTISDPPLSRRRSSLIDYENNNNNNSNQRRTSEYSSIHSTRNVARSRSVSLIGDTDRLRATRTSSCESNQELNGSLTPRRNGSNMDNGQRTLESRIDDNGSSFEAAKWSGKKIKLRLRTAGAADAETAHEINDPGIGEEDAAVVVDIVENDIDEVTALSAKSKKRVYSNNDDNDEVDDTDDAPVGDEKDDEFELDDDDDDEEDDHNSREDLDSDVEYNQRSRNRNVRYRRSESSERHRNNATVATTTTPRTTTNNNSPPRPRMPRRQPQQSPNTREEEAAREAKILQEKTARALRLAKRSGEYFEEEGGGDTGSSPDADAGGRRRNLRARKEGINYSLQMNPGFGWNGEPLEVFRASNTGTGTGGAGGGTGKNQSGGDGFSRGRPSFFRGRRDDRGGSGGGRDSHEFSYRPGKFGRNEADSDSDDDMNMHGQNGGRSSGNKSSRRDNPIEPVNILEILRAQEQSVFKDLPESEKKKYENKARLFRSGAGKDLADTDPISTSAVNFESIGGLDDHIRSLKEMVVMPLLYPEIFSGFQITPPRGVLFYGPPGTGKTLMARALASSCSTSTQKVAFFMRKGADVLSKWVGESERQLRLLFEQAKTYQPSIIFFDELDGLAPVRSSKQDQIHASIVSTLLALMDGLDSRGQVVVIGATNRIDAIDPALRRPGRFDRELFFPLPSEPARKKIISITTAKWNPPLAEKLVDDLASSTRGYCGADVRALCTEAALHAVRRSYPEIYDSGYKLEIKTEDINVTAEDFAKSMKTIIPSTHRVSTVYSSPIPKHLMPLMTIPYSEICSSLEALCPLLKHVADANVTGFMADSSNGNPIMQPASSASFLPYIFSFQPRLLICGPDGMGQKHLGPAALERLEAQNIHIQSLDLSTLFSDSSRTPDAGIIQLFHEIKRHRPAALYIPDINVWWNALPETARTIFRALLERGDAMNPVMVLATSEVEFADVPEEVQEIIQGRIGDRVSGVEGWKRVIEVGIPNQDSRKSFFEDLISSIKKHPVSKLKALKISTRREVPLARAPSPPPRELTDEEIEALFEHDESLRRQLRMELRFIINDIKRNKKFSDFLRPVDPEIFPHYYSTVTNPMDLQTLLYYVNTNEYSTLEEFIDDFRFIIESAEEFNESHSPIVGKAFDLWDNFMMYITTISKREPEFVWELKQSALRCELVNKQRKAKGLTALGREAEKTRKQLSEAANESNEIQPEDEEFDALALDLPIEKRQLEPSPPKSAKLRRIVDDDDDDDDDDQINNPASSQQSVNSQSVLEIQADTVIAETSVNVVATEEITHMTSVDVEATGDGDIAVADNAARETVVQNDDVSDDEARRNMDLDNNLANLFDDLPAKEAADTRDKPIVIDTEDEIEEKEFLLNEHDLSNFEVRLLRTTDGMSVSDLEALSVALSSIVFKFSNDWDRHNMMQELQTVLNRTE
ncbi:ATPase AAA domain-containing protein 2B [Physocladia obscura]|uniref:ATPase AAA domain-containing protein 2B n=1 Tax=Physocladia obscura TaxID=109957 RepID=A0AAD5XGV6_9FUNG|nr:ATPase AAA domain-containing protein 2B [Physocladia obscura]